METDPASASGKREPFSWKARANSFVYAFRGVWRLFRREHNAWIHLGFATGVCAAGWWWRIDRTEWALVVFAIGSVLAAEAFNTAFETFADAVKPERHPLVGRAKDLAAGGVLLAAVGAAVVGVLVFGPRFCAWMTVLYSSPSK